MVQGARGVGGGVVGGVTRRQSGRRVIVLVRVELLVVVVELLLVVGIIVGAAESAGMCSLARRLAGRGRARGRERRSRRGRRAGGVRAQSGDGARRRRRHSGTSALSLLDARLAGADAVLGHDGLVGDIGVAHQEGLLGLERVDLGLESGGVGR